MKHDKCHVLCLVRVVCVVCVVRVLMKYDTCRDGDGLVEDDDDCWADGDDDGDGGDDDGEVDVGDDDGDVDDVNVDDDNAMLHLLHRVLARPDIAKSNLEGTTATSDLFSMVRMLLM